MYDNKNALIAIALSLVILLGWQYFVAEPALEDAARKLDAQNAQQAIDSNGGLTPSAPVANGGTDAVAPSVSDGFSNQLNTAIGDLQGLQSREDSLKKDARISFENELVKGSIRLKGARIDDLTLRNYQETVDKNSPLIKLLSPAQTAQPWFVDFGWTANDQGLKLPNAQSEWQVVGNRKLTPQTPVSLKWDNGEGLIFHRTIQLDDAYLFKIIDDVENTTENGLQLYPYGIVARHGTPQTAGFYLLHEGLIGVLDEELHEIDYSDLQDDKINRFEDTKGWLGITDKYWAVTMMPEAQESFTGIFRSFSTRTDYNYQSEYLAEPVTIPANGKATHNNRIFAGAKASTLIDSYEVNENIDRFDLLIDWGWFYFLTKPMFGLLHWLFSIFGNFGIAILITTVLVKIVFFPLANKSYKSMAQMKKIAPEMTKMRERYKDDRAKQQQEMMALYKKHKVNPAAGCWPMLIQIPVFFSLYKVLFVTLEMRHAPFFGWIQDLAAPDPTSLFNLFGIFPYAPPAFLMIGIWPILMGVSMFIQMRLNPPPPDKTQQIIFDFMPLFFTFLLATFPAGLLIYWTWNNVLSILQQAIIMKRQGVKIELWDNLKRTFPFKKKDGKA